MRNLSKLSIAAFAALTLFAACSKDDKEDNNNNVIPTTPKTKKEYLTAGKWQLSAFTETWTDNGQTFTDDYYRDMDACAKDDFLVFSANGLVLFNTGSSKCDTGDKNEESRWTLIANDTKLAFEDLARGDKDTLDLADINDSIMKFKYTYMDDSATTVTGQQTYKKIN